MESFIVRLLPDTAAAGLRGQVQVVRTGAVHMFRSGDELLAILMAVGGATRENRSKPGIDPSGPEADE